MSYIGSEYVLDEIEKCNNAEERFKHMQSWIFVCDGTRVKDKIDSKKLQKLMDNQKIDLKMLGEKLKKSPITIKSWLNEKSNPSAGAIIDLTEIFDCQITDIIKTKENTVK